MSPVTVYSGCVAELIRTFAGLALSVAFSASAGAQEPPKKLWTKFETTMAHANVAGIACSLQGRTVVEGKYRPIEVHAQEDSAVLCWSGQPTADAVHASVLMTNQTNDPSRRPTDVIVEIDIPDGATPNALQDLRTALRNTVAELQRRTTPAAAPPPVVQGPPVVLVPVAPPTPMHAEQRTNWGLAGGGIAMLLSGYVLTAFTGAATVDASGDPGTLRWWPFVPFVGATVFTATYKEAADCNCSTGRVLSVVGAVAIDALQVAGAVLMIVGISTTKTRMVPDMVGVRLRPDGVLEGRF